MSSRRAFVYRVPAASPDDVSEVEKLFDMGLDPGSVVAVLGKTEGNGCVNDFTRGYASKCFSGLFEKHGVENVSIVMSGGTEGALSPHWTILARGMVEDKPSCALAIGSTHTDSINAEHIGRLFQVDMVATGVLRAMSDAGIEDPADVHYVQVKCPLLTHKNIMEAEERGKQVVTRETLKSMAYSRGASALGVAVALGEINRDDLLQEDICNRFELFSSRASTSAGSELVGHEVVVLGMGQGWSGPLKINHALMRDGIDLESVRQARSQLPSGYLSAVLAKADPDPSGFVRGRRHTMFDDSDISATRHARAFVGGALAGFFGNTDIYVSGGAEHQGPPGGGPVAVIVEEEI